MDPGHDLREAARDIRAPTLLVWGKLDPVLPLANDGQSAQRSIPGARLVVLDTGHMPFAEDPQAFLPPVLAFLREACPPTSPERLKAVASASAELPVPARLSFSDG